MFPAGIICCYIRFLYGVMLHGRMFQRETKPKDMMKIAHDYFTFPIFTLSFILSYLFIHFLESVVKKIFFIVQNVTCVWQYA